MKQLRIKTKTRRNIESIITIAIMAFLVISTLSFWLGLGVTAIEKEIFNSTVATAESLAKDLNYEIKDHDKTIEALRACEFELAGN